MLTIFAESSRRCVNWWTETALVVALVLRALLDWVIR